MWSKITDLAQKAKEAAAFIENDINNSVGLGGGAASGGTNDDSETESAPSASDGWDKCDVSLHSGIVTDEKLNTSSEQENDKSKEISFVDLKAAVDDIPIISPARTSDNEQVAAPVRSDDLPRNDEPKSENVALKDALERIASLEKEVQKLQNELASAHNTTLKLQIQIEDLEEALNDR
ncbi:hypothetical protein ACHAWU_009727 [Discostella pseudostelligera]|uniref:Golgin candidate 5 n=1 Tax=Discostella pseudostelligera TaxID=259834 RepID=A0ABD3MPD5_9STRA